MIGEIDLYGVLLPPLLVWLALGLVVMAGVRLALVKAGAYRFVWHRPLFDLALLVIVVGVIAMVVNRSF